MMSSELAERFAARGASSSFVTRIKHLGTDGPPAPAAKQPGRGVKFNEDPEEERAAGPVAGPGPRSSQPALRLTNPLLPQPSTSSRGDSKPPKPKNGFNVEDMLMRAITEDVELEDLEKMIRAEGLLGSDEEEDSPELWYDQNRKPLDAVQLAVKADIEFVMGLEMEHRAEKGMPISKKTIKRLARPHAPEGSTERQTIRKYHVGGPESWVKEKTAELKGVREKEEKKHELAGNFLEEARSRLPEFMEAKRRKEEEERLAKEAEDRAKEDDRKRANILTKQRADEELNEWMEKRKKQLEKGKDIRAKRTGMLSLHNGGVRTTLGRTDFRGSNSVTQSLASLKL